MVPFPVQLSVSPMTDGLEVRGVVLTITDMTEDGHADPELQADIAGTIAMNRFATADEIARPILWLLSDAASFISGACIDASGGGFIVGRR